MIMANTPWPQHEIQLARTAPFSTLLKHFGVYYKIDPVIQEVEGCLEAVQRG
jgi:hypothetical protein